ncbi:MAG TPA: DNA adenine methylase [Allocoleopsis sp.]
MTIKPIIGRIGGKWRISKWIIEHIKRFEWSLYVEPFCGSAAIYFQLLNEGIPELIKSRGHHPRFVLNDMDFKIINLYRVCRDFPELLAYAVYFTPYSREEHRNAQKGEAVDDLIEMCNRFLIENKSSQSHEGGWSYDKFLALHNTKENIVQWKNTSDRILTASQHLGQQFNELREGINSIPDDSLRQQSEQALNAILAEVQKTLETDIRVEFVRQFLVEGRQSASKQEGRDWGINTIQIRSDSGTNKVYDEYRQWNLTADKIITTSPHLQEISDLKKVYLENDDFEKVCRRWDTPHSLYYIDPPYYDKEDYYSEKFTKECHLRLCQMSHELEGQVIISYYPHPDILAMYSENDWEFHYKETVASSAGITRNSKTRTRPKRTELLLVRKQKNSQKLVNISGQMSLF